MVNPDLYDLHLFDLDDTLINTKEAYTQAQLSALKCYYKSISPQKIDATFEDLKTVIRTIGSGNVELYLKVFLHSVDLFPNPSPKDIHLLKNIYQENFYQLLTVFSGAKTFLINLLKKNRSIALISNGKVDSQSKKLSSLGLDLFFYPSNCYISEQFSLVEKKPSPAMIEKALADFNISADRTIFYGDKTIDTIAGNLANITTVRFSNDSISSLSHIAAFQPDHTISNWNVFFLN